MQKAAKKIQKKSALKVVKPTDLTPASYNPRAMSDETRKSLKVSMREFQDISGITWNKTTSNIVTGHHRWQNLIDAHGLESLEFKEISKDRFAIYADGEDTTFVLRVVEWDEMKEKSANVAANSPTLAGTFTADLGQILDEIQASGDQALFEDLRFNDLVTSSDGAFNGSLPGDDWESNIADVDKVPANLDGIITTIKVDCPQELRSEIFILLQETLANSKYSDKAKIK